MKIVNTIVHGIVTHKSEIFVGLSILFGAGCVTTACVQTVKACDIIEEANAELDKYEGEDSEEAKKEMRVIRKKTNMRLAKNYILPAALGVGSIACGLSAYKILSDEKAMALASAASVTAAFEKYRSRVIDKYGVEADYELYNGIKTTVEGKDEEGNTIVKVERDPIDSNCYSKIFSYETSGEWTFNRRHNIEKIKFYERYWNQQLKTKGYVTYNEVIESLGFSRKVGDDMTEPFIPNGIGWVSSENVPDELMGQFDTYIHFAPEDVDYSDEPENLVYSDAYILRFNCYPIDGLLARRSEAFQTGAH